MIYKTRAILGGIEYWDTTLKQIYFVPTGTTPDFEVGEEPKHYVDAFKERIETPEDDRQAETPELGQMTIKQLKEYAEQNHMEMPAELTKRDDIINWLGDHIG